MAELATNKVFAKVTSGEKLTGNMDFFTLTTVNAMTETNYSAADAGRNTIRVARMVGVKAQPVIVSVRAITGVDLTSATNRTLYGLGSGWNDAQYNNATVYQFKFSIEKTGVWGDSTAAWSAVDSTIAGTLANFLATDTAAAPLPYTTTVGSGSTTVNTLTFTGNSNTASLTFSSTL